MSVPLALPQAHVYAPTPTDVRALVDFDCWGKSPDGRKCGSYHAVARFYEWHGWTALCCCCGRSFTEGWMHGGARASAAKLHAARAEHAELVAAGSLLTIA